eukprot:1158209-Pelagomonas_calceolata.AAC.9
MAHLTLHSGALNIQALTQVQPPDNISEPGTYLWLTILNTQAHSTSRRLPMCTHLTMPPNQALTYNSHP